MRCLAGHKSGGVALSIHVQPKSSRNKIIGLHDDALKISLTAPPVEGKANKAVIEFLSKFFNLSKRDVELLSGHQSRKKRVLLSKIDLEDATRRVREKI